MISTVDVGCAAATLLQEEWSGHRIVELEAKERVSPKMIAAAFGKALKRTVKGEIVPRGDWESLFQAQGMKNPLPRIQMLDGFNEGWVDFRQGGAQARKGGVSIDDVVAGLVAETS